MSRTTLDALRTQIEEGYASHGTLHRLLRQWHRVDDAGIPGGGRLFESVPIALGSFDDALLHDVIHLDQIGLGFAQEEAKLYFLDPGRTTAATQGPPLDAAVGKAVAQALAYGFDAAVWVNVADEWLADTSGATVDPQPEPTRDGWWHRRRVIKTTLSPAGEIWVAGQDAGTLRYYGEHDDSESGIRLSVQDRGDSRVLRASLRLDVVKRTPAALHRITIEQ